jgi:hypothetical protein
LAICSIFVACRKFTASCSTIPLEPYYAIPLANFNQNFVTGYDIK